MRIIVLTKKNLITAGIVILLIAAAIVMAVLLLNKDDVPTSATAADDSYELTVLAGRNKIVPVYSVQRTDKKIALTIDAAWEDDKTEFILQELEKNNIKATFYLCGFWVDKYPEYVREIFEKGHELGNHTATHPHMSKLSAAQMQAELNKFEDKLVAITGEKSKTFRAPYGEYNDTVVSTVRDMGYEVIQWSIDTVDWKEERSAQTILDSVIPKLQPGCIILCHNNGFKIKEYLPELIAKALEQGYEFVTISELLLEGDTVIDVNGVQKSS